ncbi:NADH-quinone oxidoreductase subunit E [Devosia sp. YR412]|uniref:hypothetical protein n=1 Tax=Devosia sp. YR412 TaxID=1881030 RepID=UPI0008AF4CDC|nr:hypothetical protein [Devosia sp. YR412]SEP70898.1 NADH-quinone oxidoreductase subunit E [Devosia sp. YR412]
MTFNTAHLIETASLILVAYLLGCVLGYSVRRILHAGRGTREVAPIAVPVVIAAPPELKRPRSPAARLAATVEEPAPKPVELAKAKLTSPRPAALSAPRNGTADNLKQIKGIGPKIEASLNGLGIYHLDQIATWTKANVDWVDGQLAFKGRIRRERWVEQAAEMARVKADA